MINNNQRDNQWASIPLGFPKHGQTISSHGCTLSVIGDIADLTPKEVNERLQKVEGFSESMVIWTKLQEAIPWIKFEWRGYTYDNARVSANLPCLVEVDGSRIGGTKHWVLYIGNQRMYDPWTGNEKDTSFYPATGYCIVKKISEKPTDTSGELKSCLYQLFEVVIPEKEGLQRAFDEYKKTNEQTIQGKDAAIATLEAKKAELATKIDTVDAENKKLKEEDEHRVQLLAEKLLSRPDWAGIIGEIEKLITIEDRLMTCEKDRDNCAIDRSRLESAKIELERRLDGLQSPTGDKKTLWDHLLNLLERLKEWRK